MDDMHAAKERVVADDALAHRRASYDAIQKRIKRVECMALPEKTGTVCSLILDNGFSVRGEASCADHDAFNTAVSEKLAYDDAVRKLWPFFGFLQAEQAYRAKRPGG
jgi:hypothetical protein